VRLTSHLKEQASYEMSLMTSDMDRFFGLTRKAIDLAEERGLWSALVSMVPNLRVP
jgi:hypothetical protein